MRREDNLLQRLGDKYRPSKMQHDYLVHYWRHFRDVRFDVKKVCEIGVQTLRSISMWEEFFPNATICGIDIDPACRSFSGGRKEVVTGSQADEAFMTLFAQARAPFDVVIDDGSHVPAHQVASFNWLAPYMADHGTYVVEDVGLGQNQTVDAFRELTDGDQLLAAGCGRMFWDHLDTIEGAPSLFERIVGISFYRWIIFVEFGDNPRDNAYLRSPSELTDAEILRRVEKYRPELEPGRELERVRTFFRRG